MIKGTSVKTSLFRLEKWVSNHGWAGYDPYDVRGQDWFVKLFGSQSKLFRKVRGVLALLEMNLPPAGLRKFLFISKTINAKGMGLLASTYLSLYRTTQDQSFMRKAETVLDWLYENSVKNFEGFSWGYPFHWQSRIFIPKGTPSSVVTGTVGDAWLDHYLLTGSKRSMEVCRGIAIFFLTCLNQSRKSSEQICFSYTPLDDFKVHNASLFVANFLSRLYLIENDAELKDYALAAVRYTLGEQNSNGSFCYWGNEPDSIIDHYHTGFVLRHLDSIRESSGEDSFVPNIDIGYEFYRQCLFDEQGIPKFTPDSLFPIDIHSCAEAILTISQMEDKPQSDDLLTRVLEFSQDNMLSRHGYYIAEIRKCFWGKQKIDIPYMRWGQCWMLLSYARLHEKMLKK